VAARVGSWWRPDHQSASDQLGDMMKPNWTALLVCGLLGACGIVALIVGQTDMAALSIGALAGVLAPSPMPPA
jgi:hypothetical protein